MLDSPSILTDLTNFENLNFQLLKKDESISLSWTLYTNDFKIEIHPLSHSLPKSHVFIWDPQASGVHQCQPFPGASQRDEVSKGLEGSHTLYHRRTSNPAKMPSGLAKEAKEGE